METNQTTQVAEQQSSQGNPDEVKNALVNALLDAEETVAIDSSGIPIESSGTEQQQQQQGTEKNLDKNVPTFTPSPVWEQLSQRLSTAENPWEMPAHVKEGKFGEGKTELDALLETIWANTDFSTVAPKADDPFVEEYLTAKQASDFNRDAWLKSKVGKLSIFELKGKDFVKEYFTRFKLKSDENPDGYTEEDIETYINSKNRIELDREAEVLSKSLKESMSQQERDKMEKVKADALKAFTTQEENNQKTIASFIEANQHTKDFFGMEFSEADRTQFFKDLPGLFKRDPETRMSKMDSLLQSEEFVLKLAAILWKGEDGVRSHLSNLKESVKENVEEKLGLRNRQETGTVVLPKPFDPKAYE